LADPAKPLTAAGKYDFLDDDTRRAQQLNEETPISENGYDEETIRLIENARGFVLDVGAGYRPVYYSNVVNVEVTDYPTTDVIAAGDALPFRDNSFDGV
ncbi:MAG: SAM-dependent methyltransferase, partial [Methylocystis sp.]|nr:SAM-dependent methyltransferase [Methylocystis sp.]